jgi:hypothetical protein
MTRKVTPPHLTLADLWLEVVSIDKMVATQDLYSTISQFLMGAIGAPQSKDPIAASMSMGTGQLQ